MAKFRASSTKFNQNISTSFCDKKYDKLANTPSPLDY